jgi:hypothetical protein
MDGPVDQQGALEETNEQSPRRVEGLCRLLNHFALVCRFLDFLPNVASSLGAVSSNTALLAVPDVDDTFVVQRNAVQILSYVSIITSIGSIVVGLLLMRLVPPALLLS